MTGPSLRVRVIMALAVAHLALIVCGACKLDLGAGAIGCALGSYQAYSGANNSYGFFAPSVASRLRVIVLPSHDPTARPLSLVDEPESREAALRLGNWMSLFMAGDLKVQRAIAASWAAVAFSRHPHQDDVTLRVEIEVLPTMREFRCGARPRWETCYEAQFKRSAREGSERNEQ